jgi:fermentation-respiration switch protein FrsA (DUF1100 family)
MRRTSAACKQSIQRRNSPKSSSPALIIQGGRDASVSPGNAARLHRAKTDARVETFPELQDFYFHALAVQDSHETDHEEIFGNATGGRSVRSRFPVSAAFPPQIKDMRLTKATEILAELSIDLQRRDWL